VRRLAGACPIRGIRLIRGVRGRPGIRWSVTPAGERREQRDAEDDDHHGYQHQVGL
jgi:hypothetical protein